MMKKILAFTFVTGLLLTSVSQATLMTYSYIGPDFDTPTVPVSPYTVGDHVEGFITIDDNFLDPAGSGLLEANHISGVEPWLVDLSFTDGVKTISHADLSTLDQWEVLLRITLLELVAWNIDLYISTQPPQSNIITSCGDPFAPVGAGLCSDEDFGTDSASEPDGIGGTSNVSVSFPGVDAPAWERNPSAIPEPTTRALLSLGLAGLGFTRRKVKA